MKYIPFQRSCKQRRWAKITGNRFKITHRPKADIDARDFKAEPTLY